MAPSMSRAIPTTSPSPAAALYAQPSDVTLVKDVLRPWVTLGDTRAGGAAGAGAYVHAADLYSADPEELARRFQPAVSLDGECTWYFLSPLRTKSPRDRRKVRAVADGTGCWHSEAAPKNVVDYLDGGRHVGYRQSFSFMRRGGDAGADVVRDGWIMAEFHLHHYDDPDGLGRKVEGLVLCKMYRSLRHRGAAPDDDDAVSDASLSAETISFCGNSNAEDSNAAATAMAMAAPILKKKKAGDDDTITKEVSGATTAVAPCLKEKAVAVDDDEDSFASPPARKKMRAEAADAQTSGAPSAREARADGDTAAAAVPQLHCPQCGFHLAALQALVTLTKSKSNPSRPCLGDM